VVPDATRHGRGDGDCLRVGAHRGRRCPVRLHGVRHAAVCRRRDALRGPVDGSNVRAVSTRRRAGFGAARRARNDAIICTVRAQAHSPPLSLPLSVARVRHQARPRLHYRSFHEAVAAAAAGRGGDLPLTNGCGQNSVQARHLCRSRLHRSRGQVGWAEDVRYSRGARLARGRQPGELNRFTDVRRGTGGTHNQPRRSHCVATRAPRPHPAATAARARLAQTWSNLNTISSTARRARARTLSARERYESAQQPPLIARAGGGAAPSTFRCDIWRS